MKRGQNSEIRVDRMLELKTMLIDRIIIVGTALGAGVFTIAIFPLESFRANADFFYDIFALSLLVCIIFAKKKISLKVKTNIIIAILFFAFISDLLENGLFTPDPVLMVLIPFLTILVYDLRTTIIVYAFSSGVFLLMGFFIVNGFIEPVIANTSSNSYFRWIEYWLTYTLLAFVITVFLNSFHNTIYELIDSLKKQNEHLAERETTLRTIIENFPRSFVTLVSKDLTIISTGGKEFQNRNVNQEKLLGLSVEEVLLRLGRKDNQEELAHIILDTFNKTEHEMEVSFGNDFMQIKTAPLLNSKGEVHAIVVVFENITERIEAQHLIEENLEEKEVMLQEIHHRVKNNLAVVSGLLEMQSFHVDDSKLKTILSESINRIISIAKVHQMLYESEKFNSLPFKAYISELSEMIISSMNEEGKSVSVNIDISVINLGINHGVPLGIIFNELITNSVKYGFQQKEGNQINITVTSSDSFIDVIYQDNGIGIEDFEAAKNKSLGFTLIESLLQQIDATHKFETNNQFKLSFSFPAASENLLSNF